MKQCTIIVITNDKKRCDEFTAGLNTQQNVEYQLLVVESIHGEFCGARQAYNSVIDLIEYDNVVFCHHDIFFLDNNALENILMYIDSLDDFGVVGVAGCKHGEEWEILSTMLHGDGKQLCGTKIDKPTEVQCVDECFFVMQKKFVKKYRFTDMTGWHLYAVEQCVRAEQKELKNYVVPANMYHASSGNSLDPSYINALLEFKEVYSVQDGILNTTVKQWNIKTTKGYLYIKYYYWKQVIKKTLKKLGILKG